MPVCKFFLEGVCTKDNCPYRHVKVNDDAGICPDFVKGFCPKADKCTKRHVDVDKSGKEIGIGKSDKMPETPNPKKVAPAKPKRKSLCQTPVPLETAQQKKPRTRYFDEQQPNELITEEVEAKEDLDSSLQKKRERLLRKVELAKQGWTGVAVSVVPMTSPAISKKEDSPAPENVEKAEEDNLDTTPYEEIDEGDLEEDEAEPRRPPVGDLPSYISLNSASQDQQDHQDESFEERLI